MCTPSWEWITNNQSDFSILHGILYTIESTPYYLVVDLPWEIEIHNIVSEVLFQQF